jgi:ribosome-binding factor A
VLPTGTVRAEIVGRLCQTPYKGKMKHRQLRLNELVKRELSGIVARELNFEGALVSINDVDVTADMRIAHVFVSVLGSSQRENVMNKLEENRPALQAALSRKVVLKYTPHLVFHLDKSIERGARVIEIIQEIETPQDKE